ncbi:nucleoprotein TPR [Sporothrix schenckii 1099-18]|uniref:Nucleoprotein TPR n=1 Tax=Sporothrix schenckii 1099-18 TaxID=1397361 RepID=A0A0F2M8Y0_SPOSC|nr:nucleoprotein TPR [Sporothrix schenckii 1099-18]KJR85280.1 nucleoprotein TPR [Sporothrix schenckii 1099-18]
MAAATVDVGYLSTHLGVPETNLTSAVTAPTPDLVQAILEAVVTKAHEFDALYAAKLNVDIELESVVRSSEARSGSFKSAAEASRKDADDLRRKLQDEENARRAVENELQTIKASGANAQTEIERLASRNASLEASNRDTLAILESKTSANAELAEELQTQHQKTLKLNQEVTALQQQIQAAQATASSAKFREQSLQQELAFARKNNEWFEAELKTKSDESLKLRKEKGARIAELQRQNEEAQSTVAALTRSEKQLRTRLEDAQRKADEALAKVQQLQEAAARSEEGFRAELASSARLVELKEQQTETHRNRLREVELRLEQVKDESADEVRRVRNEMEQLRQDLQQAERVGQELEAEIDRIQAALATPAAASIIHATPGSAPQTPRANNGGANAGLLRAASPFGTPGSVLRGKSSISAAQAMEELYKTKGELARERRRTQELGQELDEIMSALEAKSPEIADLQEEAERLRSENVQISRLCEESFSERDMAKKAAKKAEASSITAQAEIEILRTQLRDLSTQIQLLVFTIQAREKGLDELSDEEARQFERLQRGQVAEGSLDDMSDTHQFISERFVVFKDIQELQTQNAELLRMTREFATKMESEEASEAKRQVEQDRAELLSLRDTVGRLQDESKAVTVRMKSYMTERDMFRRMLQQKASHAEISSVLGAAAAAGNDPATPGQNTREVLASIEHTGSATDDSGELTVALRELQNNFDAYRNEQGVDRETMRAQVDKLSHERSILQGEIARINSQLTLASERYEILQSNYAALETDNKALQEKNQSLSESYAKQDIRTQQVAMDLVEVRSLLESMRNENANLKAEKSLWKGIQDRLAQDNESLNEDKSRLNTLLSSQQSLLNERELSESETKRRLQTQIDNLEAELTTTKRKLSEEIEDAKKLQLRKEYDAQQSQKRIDDLMASIAQSKEELVALKTSRDHLQARVNELTIELRNAEERTQRLQPRPTPRAPPPSAQQQEDGGVAGADGGSGGDDEGEGAGGSASRADELEAELSDLRRDLDLARIELASSKEEANSYKDIAHAIEDDLNNLNEAQDQYRQEMDGALEAKEARIKELEQRVEALSAELATSTNELNGLRDSQADLTRKLDDEKRILESEIARLKDSEDRYKDEKKYHQSDLRAQAEIATRAQKDYEQELVKHAEAAKQLQVLRSEHNHLRTEAASWRAEADSAKLALAQSESSWEERRQQFEQELIEIKARRDDTNAQNKLLGQQLETVTAQIASLQQSRSAAAAGIGATDSSDNNSAEGTPSAFADAATEGLRELNNYLRREKEILEVQYDLKLQENQRLQQKHDYAQAQLDEARLKLEQERRAQADVSRSSQTHKELMEKLNELNLIRESNVTLRNDNQHAQAQLVLKDGKIEMLHAQIQPLEQRVAELENQKLFMDEEVKQITEDRERWQKRTESILSKYGRVDPTELDQLKESMAALEAERSALQTTETELRAKITELETSLESDRGQWRETRQKLIEQAKEKARQQGAQIRELTSQKTELQEQATAAAARLATVEQELEAANAAAKAAVESRANNAQQEEEAHAASVPSTPAPTAAMDVNGQQQQPPADTNALSTDDAALLQHEVHQLRGELEVVRTEKAAVEQELVSLRTQLDTAVAERDQAVAQAQAALAQAQAPAQNPSGEYGAAAPAANGFAGSAAPAAAVAPLSDAEKEELQQRIAAAEARAAAFEQKAKEVEDNIQSTLKERSDKMKDALNKKLKETKEKAEQEVREAREKLQAELDLRVEQEKKIWMAEQSSTGTAAPAPAPGEATSEVPSTPAKAEPGTPTTAGTPLDLSKLGDTETRELLANNATIRSIVTANIKKKIESETKKVRDEVEQAVKAEYDAKITSARESGQMMAEKKSSIRINMAENKLKTATAKLDVVSTAAQQTPQRPVGEVWAIAKDARPAPATPAASNPATPAPGTPGPAAAQPPARAQPPATPAAVQAATPAAAPGALRPQPQQQPQQQQRVSSLPTKPQPANSSLPSSLPAPAGGPPALDNPFLSKPSEIPQPNNPFAKAAQQQQQQQQQPQQQQQHQPQHQPQQSQQQPQRPQSALGQQQGGPRSGIPVPGSGRGGAHGNNQNSNRGGAGGAGRGGVYQAPRGRGRGGMGQNQGRGGGNTGGGGGGANLNPSADAFNPGNKRPRNDGGDAAGGGVKRMRGGGGPGGPAGGQAGGAGGAGGAGAGGQAQ